MFAQTLDALKRLAVLLAAVGGLSQGLPSYEITNGPAQFPSYSALTASDSVFRENTYIGNNAIVRIEEHSRADNTLSSPYTLADIYLPDVHMLKTYYMDAAADGLKEPAGFDSLCRHVNAAFAVNGDFYDPLSGKSVVRDGIRIGAFVNTYDLCVLYENGEMKTFFHGDINQEALVEAALQNAWQVWSFGPALLDANGNAIADFSSRTPEYITRPHPRTCIGYYSPGHYCILMVAGYQEFAPGVLLEELSAFFAGLGCTQAYNLDGGASTHMWFHNREICYPAGDRLLTDLIYIEDTSSSGQVKGGLP